MSCSLAPAAAEMRDSTLRQWTVSHSVDVPGDGRGARREDRSPFRRRQSPQPAHQNASFLVFPDKIIAAVSINNSPMAETFAHLPACSLGRPVPFPAWCREYLEKEFWCLRGAQCAGRDGRKGETSARLGLIFSSYSRLDHVCPFLGALGSVSSVFSPPLFSGPGRRIRIALHECRPQFRPRCSLLGTDPHLLLSLYAACH